jgi:hypothetical protein
MLRPRPDHRLTDAEPAPGLVHAFLFTNRLRQMKSLLFHAIQTGHVRIDGRSTELLARCVIDIQWIPENIRRQDLGCIPRVRGFDSYPPA